MTLVNVKPTSPGRRAVIKIVNKDLYKGDPYHKLVEKKKRQRAATTPGGSQHATRVVATNKIIASLTFGEIRMA